MFHPLLLKMCILLVVVETDKVWYFLVILMMLFGHLLFEQACTG